MKKGWKCFCTVAGGAALYAGASFVKDYRNMKKMEKRSEFSAAASAEGKAFRYTAGKGKNRYHNTEGYANA